MSFHQIKNLKSLFIQNKLFRYPTDLGVFTTERAGIERIELVFGVKQNEKIIEALSESMEQNMPTILRIDTGLDSTRCDSHIESLSFVFDGDLFREYTVGFYIKKAKKEFQKKNVTNVEISIGFGV